MLNDLKRHFEDPDNIPAIPEASSQFLQGRLNFSYLSRSGALDDLRRQGWSEQAIYGFIEGANCACEVIELMERTQMDRWEDNQI